MARGGRWRAVSLGLAVVLGAVLLYYSVRGLDWGHVARIAAGADPGLLGVSAVLATATLFLRAYRWRILLRAGGPVSVSDAFWATAAGNFGNNFLPARAGELVRTHLVSARSPLDHAFVLATALSDRAADAVALLAISALVVLALPEQPGWLSSAGRSFAVIGLIGAAGIAAVPFLGPAAKTLVERGPVPHGLRPRLLSAVEQGIRGVRAFHDARRLSGFLAVTAGIWCLDAIGAIVAAEALGLQMSMSAALLLIAGLGLGTALPSTPGYVGIYQFVAVTVLAPFGFSRTEAIAYILIVQALSYVVIAIWGGLGLWRHHRRT